MTRKNILILFTLVLIMTGCQRGCERIKYTIQSSERNYKIVVFSGGDTVFTDQFRGMINNSENSDGIYYTKNGQLIEISGDYIITSTAY